MSQIAHRLDISIRPFKPDDEDQVISLLEATLGGGPTGDRTREFFRWKHLQSPFGTSLLLVADLKDEIVGLRAFMRWHLWADGELVRAVRAVDTATHPSVQGRGVFSRLTEAALGELRGNTDLVFNTPNKKSLPGYLKMGWQRVGDVPIRLWVRRPLRFALRAGRARGQRAVVHRAELNVDAPAAEHALVEPYAADLPKRIGRAESVLSTLRNASYLRWRYAQPPGLDYRAVLGAEGIAIFRVRMRGSLREATVAELLVEPEDATAARQLLNRVVDATDVDYLAYSFPRGTAAHEGTRRPGRSLSAPTGMTLVANPLSGSLSPDPLSLDSWALSLGDLEVF